MLDNFRDAVLRLDAVEFLFVVHGWTICFFPRSVRAGG